MPALVRKWTGYMLFRMDEFDIVAQSIGDAMALYETLVDEDHFKHYVWRMAQFNAYDPGNHNGRVPEPYDSVYGSTDTVLLQRY